MKRLTITATAVFLALGLTACASPFEQSTTNSSSAQDRREISVQDVDTPDGHTVTCIIWDGGYPGGISCDWDGAR